GDVGPVAMDPDAREPRPVRREVALSAAPETAGHARPGLPDREFADLAADTAALLVKDVRGNPRERTGKRARPEVGQHVAAEDAPGDLGATRVIDDGELAPADLCEVPVERVGVPGFPGPTQHAKAGEVMAARMLAARGHQASHQGGGDAEDRDLVVGDHSPQPRSEEHTSELQSLTNLVCRLLLEKKKKTV